MTSTPVRHGRYSGGRAVGFLWLTCLIALLVTVDPRVSWADTAADSLRQALQDLERDDPRAALEGLEKAYHEVWLQTDFHITKSVLASRQPSDFGIYEPRSDTAFLLGDTVFLYYEIAAFKYRSTERGLEFGIEMDVEMRDTAGRSVLQVSRVLSQVFEANRAVKEMYLSLSIDLESDLSGPYVVKTILRDLVSGEETTDSLEIIVKGESG